MATLKKAALLTILVCTCCMTSGCATIVGGIIGHQSGEMVAGLAIGAGIDFGGAIIGGIGNALTDQKTHFSNDSQLNSEEGEIILPKAAFNVDQTKKILNKLQMKLDADGWTNSTTMMKSQRHGSRHTHEEKVSFECSTDEIFDLNAYLQKGCDQRLTIHVPDGSSLNRSEITIKVYAWIEEIVRGKAT